VSGDDLLHQEMLSKYTTGELSLICQSVLARAQLETLQITLKTCNSAEIIEERQDAVALKYQEKLAESLQIQDFTSVDISAAEIPSLGEKISMAEILCLYQNPPLNIS